MSGELWLPRVKPASARAPRFPSVCYYPHKPSASADLTLTDALGNGPALTLNSAVGTTWSANRGYATYSGTNAFISPVNNAFLASLMRLDNIAGQQLLVGYVLKYSGEIANHETIFMWGRHQSNSAAGGYYLSRAGTEQVSFLSRPPGASLESSAAFPSSAQQTTNPYVNVLSIEGRDGLVAWLQHSAIDLVAGTQYASGQAWSLWGDGTGAPGAAADSSLKLGARELVAASYDRQASSQGGAMKAGTWWAARLPAMEPGLAEACLLDMRVDPHGFPRSLTQFKVA